MAMSADCNTRFCYINPQLGAAAAVMEKWKKCANDWSSSKAITDCF